MSKPVTERTHRRMAEMRQMREACPEGVVTAYEDVNRIDFKEAWKIAVSHDAGIPDDPPEDLAYEAKRAIVTLARRLGVMEHEWS